jgi:arylsulfatase A-like enzyme
MSSRVAIAATVSLLLLASTRPFFARPPRPQAAPRHNVIIFVADGLRHGSVNAQDTPALWSIRTQGVHFTNSHSLFPTFTTANASAIATGHGLGDTGDFSNTLWVGYPLYETGNFDLGPGTPTPFLENDQVLADLDNHYGGNYLHEPTLLVTAAANGYNTASIGKLGPTAIAQAEAIAPNQGRFPQGRPSIIIDDATGSSAGVPLRPGFSDELLAAGLSLDAPGRTNGYEANSPWNNGNSGNATRPGTLHANVVQQQWFADVATRVVLPDFQRDSPKPFLLLYWSRDPDASQHNEGDSLNSLFPGVNGPTALAGVRNADHNLKQILDWLDVNPAIKAQTDIFVTSDHGFATVSRREVTRTGKATASESAKHNYWDSSGNVETAVGTLPSGFLAIDLAIAMNTNLFDPDRHADRAEPYRKLRLGPDVYERPSAGDGLLGESVRKVDGSDALAIVAAGGGSDLIYVPDKNPETVRRIVGLLAGFDYVDGLFVDDQYGAIPGALSLSSIGLLGNTPLPRPAIVVTFKTFYTDPANLMTGVQVSDTTLQEGQGNHGGFGREVTFNNMAALGPDFKSGFEDPLPVSNADIVPTLAHILGFSLTGRGKLSGRIISEALRNTSSSSVPSTKSSLPSSDANGLRTILEFQDFDGHRYLDRACLAPSSACP